ncbi:MAG: VanZ family protein [Methylococcales bacterium]|nr:VanZ family protein [Methylococcales bacterium]
MGGWLRCGVLRWRCTCFICSYTEAVYRNAILAVGKILLGVYVLWLVWCLRLTAHKWLKISVWLLFAGVLTTYYNDMVKISIEYVHFMQYCGLTIVVAYALRGRALLACAVCLLAGFMDEVYQTLEPVSQLNWRDVGLNVTGCVWGWLLLWTLKTDVVSSR